MRRVRLRNTDIETTAIGYGTSRLHYVNRATRNALIRTAYDVGIRHFDTAPSYADGMAESALGEALRGLRSEVTIATKFGVSPNVMCLVAERVSPLVGVVARGASAVVRRIKGEAPLEVYDTRELERSLSASLKRLQTDFLDILFLHEPSVRRLARQDELWEICRRLQSRGVVRSVGLAGRWEDVRSVRALIPDEIHVVTQTGEWEWSPPDEPDITFGVLARGPQKFFQRPAVPRDVANAIRGALARRTQGCVLVSTTKVEHLHDVVLGAR